MEWHIMNAGGVSSLCSGLGVLEDNVYVPSDDCEDVLQDLISQVQDEDKSQRLVRREFLYLGIIEKDLIPLIQHVRDDPSVFSACIRLLAQVTMPIECLLSEYPKNNALLPWIPDIQKLLIDSKKFCGKYEFLHALITEIRTVIEDSGEYDFSDEDCEFINQGLILVRNLLHVTDKSEDYDLVQTEFLRILFICGLGDLVITLLSRNQRGYWSLTLIQLISLLYKGQVVKILRNNDSDDDSIFNGESEVCGAECRMCATAGKFDFEYNSKFDCVNSSEDEVLKNGVSPSMETASESMSTKTMSDESLNSKMDISDSGKSKSNDSSNSSSPSRRMSSEENMSNDSSQSSNDWAEKNRDNNEHHNNQQNNPHEEVRRFLFKFTCDFIQNGFKNLINELKSILISTGDTLLDDSYLWSLSFFLKFARQQNLKFSYFRDIFEAELFGFLTYEGIYNLEQMLIKQKQKNKNSDAYTKRINLTVCALREVFKTLAYHRGDPKLKKDDKQHIEKLEADLAQLTDMHQLFVLLIRHSSENASYLKDVIVINHLFLVLLEKWRDTGYLKSDYKMFDLIQNFATTTVMKKFSTVLSNFVENGHTVNNCIFTMMHHVAGDCGQSDVLLQSGLLKTFLEIWDNKFYVTQETNDLMEYVMQQFVSKAENDPMSCAMQMFGESTNENSDSSSSEREAISSDGDSEKGSEDGRTDSYLGKDEEEDMLVMLFSELQDDPDPIGKIVERFDELGIYKSKSQIVEQLSELDWIDNEQVEPAGSEKDSMDEQQKEDKSLNHELTGMNKDEIVPYCIQKLNETGKSKCLHWLQEILCEVAYVKLDSGIVSKKELEQPVPKFYTLQQKSVPLVLYSDQQEDLLNDPYFFTLIQYLGFHTPEDVGMLFPRIPHFWSPDMLLDKAKQLGPIDTDKMKFDMSAIKDGQEFQGFTKLNDSNMYHKPDGYQNLKNINENGISSSHVPGAMWIDAIQVYNNQRNAIMDVENDRCCVNKT